MEKGKPSHSKKKQKKNQIKKEESNKKKSSQLKLARGKGFNNFLFH
jgi:hypothetical protein